MTNDQLLQELETRELVSKDALTKIKREVLISGRGAEDLIHERRLIDDEKIAEMKSQILKIPYQKIDFSKFDDSMLNLMSEETVRTYGVVPLGKQDGIFIAGMLQPDDAKAQDALKFIARKERVSLGVYVISWSDWQEVLRKYSPYKTNLEAVVRSLNLKPGSANKAIGLESDAPKTGEEAPIIKIVSDTFREAVQARASDIHLEPQETHLRIRFRVDGDLKEIMQLPPELIQPVTSRVKIISNLKIDESRVPQDGRFRAKIMERDIDFRVATFPTPLGEKIAIRVLDPSTGLKTLEQLGIVGKNMEIMKKGIERPYGMILVSGPTGSGKSTTLYALLQSLNSEEVNIVSLEDPVEYFVSGVNQSQVHPEIGYDFASGLRQILRQDPDIIMVGEIRDNETAGLAVQAALTGHIVLSTIHTNNSAGVIPRLLDMKVEPFLLPVSLNLMVAQRLVGKLCDSCKVQEDAPPALEKAIAKTLALLPAEIRGKYKAPYRVSHAPGCNVCRGKGVIGRIGIYELLLMTTGLQEAINTGPTLQKIWKEARSQKMITLRQDGILKALEGTVSAEEIIRTTEEGYEGLSEEE